MTEDQWLASDYPRPMLAFLRGKTSDRKFRLFQVACCLRAWDLLSDDLCREAVLVAERFADGHATDQERQAALERVASGKHVEDDLLAINARHAATEANEKTAGLWSSTLGVASVLGHAANRGNRGDEAAYRAALQARRQAEACLVRCVFGNPFRPSPPTDPGWRTLTVLDLAQAAYEERQLPSGLLDPPRLLVLADALEEVGCDDGHLLAHIRGPGPHVRGCHVIDWLTGRS